MDINGSVALVTGAASGLGNAVARTLQQRGAEVVIVDLPSTREAEIVESIGAGTYFVGADVTSATDVAAAVDLAASLGDLRIVVNCAGIATPGKLLGRDGALPLEDFERVVRINLIGTFNVIRLAAAKMVAAAGGKGRPARRRPRLRRRFGRGGHAHARSLRSSTGRNSCVARFSSVAGSAPEIMLVSATP